MCSANGGTDVSRAAGLRVLQVVTSSAFAGIERHVLYLARELQQLGCAAELACPPAAVRLRQEAAAAGVVVRPLRCRQRSWLAALARQVAKNPPDVLHVHDGRAAVAAGLLGPLTGGVMVRTQHFTRPASVARNGWRRSLSLRLHRILNQKLDGYICVSTRVADGARDRRDTRGAEVMVIPPGIELPSDHAVARARSIRPPMMHTVVAFAGRLEPERQLDVLLNAVPRVLDQMPDCRFVFAGGGSAEQELKSLARQLKIEQAVTWKGWVAEPYALLEQAHLYVNPWPWEGFGMAMAEAMAMALPVIAVDSGASSDIVDPGITGRLVPADDAPALAAAIVELGSDRSGAAAMGEAAHERAVSLYGAQRTAEATLGFYCKLLSKARP